MDSAQLTIMIWALYIYGLMLIGAYGALAVLWWQRRTEDHGQDRRMDEMQTQITHLNTAQGATLQAQQESRVLLEQINEQVRALATEARMREIVRQEVGRGVTSIGSVLTGGGGAAIGGALDDQRKG